jgi:TRAP-type C4-dicarboxylate transport system permease small subunit
VVTGSGAMTRLADGLFYVLKIFAALGIAVMVVLVFTNVVLRYAFNEGIAVSEELSTWLLVWVTYVAGLVALRDHGHLGFDSFVTHLPPGGRRACLILAQLLMIGVTWLFLQGSWEQTRINLESYAPASGLSQGWLYGTGILFSVIALALLLVDLFRAVTGRLHASELVMVGTEAAEALAEADRHPLEVGAPGTPAPPAKGA